MLPEGVDVGIVVIVFIVPTGAPGESVGVGIACDGVPVDAGLPAAPIAVPVPTLVPLGLAPPAAAAVFDVVGPSEPVPGVIAEPRVSMLRFEAVLSDPAHAIALTTAVAIDSRKTI